VEAKKNQKETGNTGTGGEKQKLLEREAKTSIGAGNRGGNWRTDL